MHFKDLTFKNLFSYGKNAFEKNISVFTHRLLRTIIPNRK